MVNALLRLHDAGIEQTGTAVFRSVGVEDFDPFAGERHSGDVVIAHHRSQIQNHDDGIGMKEDALKNIMAPKSETGLGIAVKNINDRLRGYYGEKAYMDIQSELGKGTSVTLFLPDCANL